MRCRTFVGGVWVACLIVALSGCSKGPWPVEGTITLDGKPLPGATIMFFPEDKSLRQANAYSNAEGWFKLSTHNKDGAMPGKYKVVVSKKVYPPGVKPPDPSNMPNMMEMQKIQQQMKESVPKVYTTQKDTILTVDIPPGGKTDVRLDLKEEAKGSTEES